MSVCPTRETLQVLRADIQLIGLFKKHEEIKDGGGRKTYVPGRAPGRTETPQISWEQQTQLTIQA